VSFILNGSPEKHNEHTSGQDFISVCFTEVQDEEQNACLPAELSSDSPDLLILIKQIDTITASMKTATTTNEQPYLRIGSN